MPVQTILRRLLSLLLCLSLILGMLSTGAAALGTEERSASLPAPQGEAPGDQAPYSLTEPVRVSILLEQAGTLEAGYPMEGIAQNAQALAYRQELRRAQDRVQAKIEALTGHSLELRWNLSLATNAISATVPYGELPLLEGLPEVRGLLLENCYEAPETETELEPQTASTVSGMVEAAQVWAEGYTGAGTRIAIIDTGLDTEHQSVNPEAFRYAIQELGMSDSLFTSTELAGLRSQLNGSGAQYFNAKVPFGYNYRDQNTVINHRNDTQGDHGSHVAGIAAANRYIKKTSGYSDALSAVSAVGVAPDAQLFIMKVFGAGGGAYDSDYMVAIEDAIVLGCDAVNLSLGSVSQGFSFSAGYQEIVNKLAEPSANPKLVVTVSGGNGGAFTRYLNRELYIEDVGMHTGGSPGSFGNTLATAAAANTGVDGCPLLLGTGSLYFSSSNAISVYYGADSANRGAFRALASSSSLRYVYLKGTGTADQLSALNAAVALSGKLILMDRGDIPMAQKAANLAAYNPKALVIVNSGPGTLVPDLEGLSLSFPVVTVPASVGTTLAAKLSPKSAGSSTYYTSFAKISTASSGKSAEFPEMAVFSSWGVPGSLVLKPEITAPGGSIYSIQGSAKTSSGTTGGSDKYVTKSGTSMAAPHMAGLSALLGQYLAKTGRGVPGRTTRQLVQSLLMSTAVPLREGSAAEAFYPVLQQGAGLANVEQAIHAGSAIFMEADACAAWADGKVKAELGDKPERTGSYSFSFRICNRLDRAQDYRLSTELFTQGRSLKSGLAYLSASTVALPWTVSYSGTDVGENSVTVPAGESRLVQVSIQIPPDMADFDSRYPKGAYVEGYTFIESQTSSEDGARLDVTHSIPILGFYGSWTDPSMFDATSNLDSLYGTGRTSYSGVKEPNSLQYSRDGASANVRGNPYTLERPFPAEKLALRSTDLLESINYLQLRAAGTTGFALSRVDPAGKVQAVLHSSVTGTNVLGMWYSSSKSAWQNVTAGSCPINSSPAAFGLEDGERFRVGCYAVPEYYALQINSDKSAADSGQLSEEGFQTLLRQNLLGKGAMVGYDFYVDDSPPVVLSALKTGNTCTVQVRDNNYLAWLALTDAAGKTVYASTVPAQSAPGETLRYSFDSSGISGDYWVLAGDYAANETLVAPAEPSYTITALSNDEDLGRVQVSGRTLIALPAEGCYLDTVELTQGQAQWSREGNQITVEPESDCSFLFRFLRAPVYRIRFSVPAGIPRPETLLCSSLSSVSLPQAQAPEGYSFVGWVTERVEHGKALPQAVRNGSYTPEASVLLRALYRGSEGEGTPAYGLVTAPPEDWSGSYVITWGRDEGLWALKGLSGDQSYESESAGGSVAFAETGFTLEGSVLTGVPEAYVFDALPFGGGFSLQNRETGTWLASASSTLYSHAAQSSADCVWALSLDSSLDCAVVSNSASSSYPYLCFATKKNCFVVNNSYSSRPTQLWREFTDPGYFYTTVPGGAAPEPIEIDDLEIRCNISLGSEFVVNYRLVNNAAFQAYGFDSFYMEFLRRNLDGTTTATRYGEGQEEALILNGTRSFDLRNNSIPAAEMGVGYALSFHGFAEGQEYVTAPMEGSLRDFFAGQLESLRPEDDRGEARLRLAADSLRYGAEAQAVFNPDQGDLLEGLSEQALERLEAYGSTEVPEARNQISYEDQGLENPILRLSLQDRLEVTVRYRAPGAEGPVEVELWPAGDPAQRITLPAVLKSGTWTAVCGDIGAAGVRTLYCFRVLANGVPVTNLASWSVESYIAAARERSDGSMDALYDAILRFGDSLVQLFG